MKPLKSIDVYLIAGQSNAVGCTRLSTLPAGFVPETFDRVLLYQEGNFCPTYYGKVVRGVRPGMGCNEDFMGIEYGIAAVLQEKSESESALIRYGFGGSNLFLDWQPRYLWQDKPRFHSQYGFSYKAWAETVVNGLQALMEEGCIPRVRALAWMQGESDADKGEEIANGYFERLCDLIFTMRAELREPELPVAVGEIATHAPSAPWSDIVRDAQRKFAESDAHAALVSTSDIPVGTDGLHFDAPEDLVLGRRFGEALLTLAGRAK